MVVVVMMVMVMVMYWIWESTSCWEYFWLSLIMASLSMAMRSSSLLNLRRKKGFRGNT